MKNLLIGFGLTLITIFSIVILHALNTNTTQQNKLETSVRLAAYQAVSECFKADAVPMTSDEQLIKKFNKNLAAQLNVDNSNAKKTYKVKIIEADYKNGLLSAEVVQTYHNLNIERTIAARTTVVYDELEN